jgi:uncharacterized protein DUF4124
LSNFWGFEYFAQRVYILFVILMNRGGKKMCRISLFVIVFIMMTSFLSLRVVIAQTMNGETEVTSPASQTPSQGTDVLQSAPNTPVIDNSGIVYPRENLNPFGLSTIGGSTDPGERKGEGTLGVNIKQKSNVEVNKPKETKEATREEGKSGGEATATAAGGGETPQVTSEEPAEALSPSLSKSSGLYRWKDKNGVVHATNNLGSVPSEYQNQVKESEKGKGEEVAQPQNTE